MNTLTATDMARVLGISNFPITPAALHPATVDLKTPELTAPRGCGLPLAFQYEGRVLRLQCTTNLLPVKHKLPAVAEWL